MGLNQPILGLLGIVLKKNEVYLLSRGGTNLRDNLDIAHWYMNTRIPQMLRYYGMPDTVDNHLIAYNFGIGNLIRYTTKDIKLPKETRNYIRKYHKLELKKRGD